MITFTWPGSAPSDADVKARYAIADDEMDASFGVILLDPVEELYVVLVDQSAATRIQGTAPDVQVYGDVAIQPFGLDPVETPSKK